MQPIGAVLRVVVLVLVLVLVVLVVLVLVLVVLVVLVLVVWREGAQRVREGTAPIGWRACASAEAPRHLPVRRRP